MNFDEQAEDWSKGKTKEELMYWALRSQGYDYGTAHSVVLEIVEKPWNWIQEAYDFYRTEVAAERLQQA